jgi:antitoxin VapB
MEAPMARSINGPEVDRLGRGVAALTGESLTRAVRISPAGRRLVLGRRCAALPAHDTGSPDEIIGHDEHGDW